jgi:hypothetical protein
VSQNPQRTELHCFHRLTHPNSAVLTVTQFIDAPLMATAVEFCAQEHFDAFFRQRFADHPSAHRQNIRVIMLAAQPRP